MDAPEDDDLPAYMTPLYRALAERDFAKAKTIIDSGCAIAAATCGWSNCS